mgnify:CR=1 FL=1
MSNILQMVNLHLTMLIYCYYYYYYGYYCNSSAGISSHCNLQSARIMTTKTYMYVHVRT